MAPRKSTTAATASPDPWRLGDDLSYYTIKSIVKESDLASMVSYGAVVEGQGFVLGKALVPPPGEGRMLVFATFFDAGSLSATSADVPACSVSRPGPVEPFHPNADCGVRLDVPDRRLHPHYGAIRRYLRCLHPFQDGADTCRAAKDSLRQCQLHRPIRTVGCLAGSYVGAQVGPPLDAKAVFTTASLMQQVPNGRRPCVAVAAPSLSTLS